MYVNLQNKLNDIARRLERLSKVEVSFDVDGDEERGRFTLSFDFAADRGSDGALDEIEEALADIVAAIDVASGTKLLRGALDIARVQAQGVAV